MREQHYYYSGTPSVILYRNNLLNSTCENFFTRWQYLIRWIVKFIANDHFINYFLQKIIQNNIFSDIDECKQGKCGQNSNCLNLPGRFKCSCLKGFQLSTPTLCVSKSHFIGPSIIFTNPLVKDVELQTSLASTVS